LTIVVGAVGIVIAIKLFNQYEQAPYQVSNVATTAVTDTSVSVAFDVTVPAGAGASCTVTAATHDGVEIATAEVAVPPVPAGQQSAHVTYTLKTPQRAFAGTVPGCGPSGS
jgi:hypothetical protein